MEVVVKRVQVKSSAFAEIGHDEATSILEVMFHPCKGGWSDVWHYSPVSRELFEEILLSESVGKTWREKVKNSSDISSYKIREEMPEVPAA